LRTDLLNRLVLIQEHSIRKVLSGVIGERRLCIDKAEMIPKAYAAFPIRDYFPYFGAAHEAIATQPFAMLC
jgi:hypothetical protein